MPLNRRIERLRRGTDISPQKLRSALESIGFVLLRTSGSHQIYRHPDLASQLVIPLRRPIKPVYVRQALAAIEEVLSS